MLLIASLCIIGDPLLDKVEVDNRQAWKQRGFRLTALHPLGETSIRDTREA